MRFCPSPILPLLSMALLSVLGPRQSASAQSLGEQTRPVSSLPVLPGEVNLAQLNADFEVQLQIMRNGLNGQSHQMHENWDAAYKKFKETLDKTEGSLYVRQEQ